MSTYEARPSTTEILSTRNPALKLFVWCPSWAPVAVWGATALTLMVLSVFPGRIGAPHFFLSAFLGLVFWTGYEYCFHRFFHTRSPWRWLENAKRLLHNLHHEEPTNRRWMLMPPLAALLLAVPLFGLSHLAFSPAFANCFFAFFLLGYLSYDYLHYSYHTQRFANAHWRSLQRHHLEHHFVSYGKSNWGVTSTLVDLLLGTKV
jgi:sterol desaturase/sphingolipid hydroxylase (fatty acid hydroxylase superfamily)